MRFFAASLVLISLANCSSVQPVGALGAAMGNPRLKAKESDPAAFIHVPAAPESRGMLRFESSF